jgi:rare lipoprotein A (peptidoglycan hydrolase)
VKHAASGRSIVVRINDREPFHGDSGNNPSEAVALTIGLGEMGAARVDLSLLRHA